MSFDLKKAAKLKKAVYREGEGEDEIVINMTVDTASITAGYMKEMRSMFPEEGAAVTEMSGFDDTLAAADMAAQTLSTLIKEWDVVNDGEPVPITKEVMAGLPLGLLMGLFKFVIELVVPKKKIEPQSGDSTSPEEKAETSLQTT